MEDQHISTLIIKYLHRTITDAEKAVLDEWIQASAAHRQRFQELTDPVRLKQKVQAWQRAGGDADAAWTLLQQKWQGQQGAPVVRRMLPVGRYWSIAAAAVLLFVVFGLWFMVGRRGPEKPAIVQTPTTIDIGPGRDGAMLTLADGRKIILDSMADGVVAQQNGGDVKLNNGSLEYEKSGVGSRESGAAYNTLQTPRGRQFQLMLPDGSKVWLNAASSITYPVAFNDKQRKVKITGEAYFEVSSNKEKPFIVDVDSRSEVEVLGTHFNINSYADEDAIRTTLLEGKVKVSRTDSRLPAPDSRLLTPGKQAIITNHITVTDQIDIEEITAWKNGRFYFNDRELSSVLKQIARWYDVDIVYEGKAPAIRLNGEANRQMALTELLHTLQLSDVQCRIEGRKLIVPEQ